MMNNDFAKRPLDLQGQQQASAAQFYPDASAIQKALAERTNLAGSVSAQLGHNSAKVSPLARIESRLRHVHAAMMDHATRANIIADEMLGTAPENGEAGNGTASSPNGRLAQIEQVIDWIEGTLPRLAVGLSRLESVA